MRGDTKIKISENNTIRVNNIVPLSVNVARKGKRYKTDKYRRYETILKVILPSCEIEKEGNLVAIYHFGFSSPLADYDNPIKPLQDVLQKRY